MEFSKESERFYVFTRAKLGDGAQQIFENLHTVHGDKCSSIEMIRRWMREFNAGQQDLHDRPRSGRPKSVVNEGSIDRVRNLLAETPGSTIENIMAECGLSYGTVENILHEELGVRKVCAKWVPHKLTQEQKETRVILCRQNLKLFDINGSKRLTDIVTGDETWLYYYNVPNKVANMVWLAEDEPRPKVLRQDFRSKKRMYTIFINYQGPICVDVLPENTTMTGAYYKDTILTQVCKKMAELRPKMGSSRMQLLHDNASSHKTVAVKEYLQEKKISVIAHPPYSPDLAICDFWLFPKLKKQLAGKPFSRVQDQAKSVNSELLAIPPFEYRGAFDTWLIRLQKCIDANGEYFEGF